MGIDNSAVLVIGAILTEEELQKILNVLTHEFTEGFDGDSVRDSLENRLLNGDYNFDDFPNLCVGYANPYYDCDFSERVYFVSGIATDGIPLGDLLPVIQQMNAENSEFYRFLAHFGLEKHEPCLYALPHIW